MERTKEVVEFSLKVIINKDKTRVLFAEAESDFVDVLLSFLTLPMGKVVRILKKHCQEDKAPRIGSLNTLYEGLADLNDAHFWSEGGKQMLLNPTSSFEFECRKLKLNVDDDARPIRYYTCADGGCKRIRSPNISMYHDTRKCSCGKLLNKPLMGMGDSKAQDDDDDGDGDDMGVFTEKTMSFLISDGLRLAPNVPGSVIETLSNFGINETDGAEMRVMRFGFDMIMQLLRVSLVSKTPLTDLIIHERHRLGFVTEDLHHQMEKHSTCKKMIVKAMVQKSTNKLLFVQAEEDFVDFLFSMLVIPLGGVEYLLGGKTSFWSIDNLYRSIAYLDDDKYLRTRAAISRLVKPELPPKYLSKNQIFPLTEKPTPTVYYCETVTSPSNWTVERGSWMCFKDPKGEGSYVKKPGTFMVSDDLTVTPLSVTSSLSVLSKVKIPLYDVKEMELHVGLEEALGILKATLSSTCALTNGLINPMLKKQAEQHN